MELDAYGQVQSTNRLRVAQRLALFLAESNTLGVKPTGVRFDVMQLIPGASFNGCNQDFIPQSWTPAFMISINSKVEPNIIQLTQPILGHPTGRNLEISNHRFAEQPNIVLVKNAL